jgi:hypothetical protein
MVAQRKLRLIPIERKISCLPAKMRKLSATMMPLGTPQAIKVWKNAGFAPM